MKATKRVLPAAFAVSVAYFKVSGRSQVKEDGISGMVSIRF